MKKKKEALVRPAQVNANNYLTMFKGAEIAVVSYIANGTKRCENIPYENLKDLSLRIWLGIQTKPSYKLDETTVKLPDGNEYRWNETFVHYCFAHGRISKATFVEFIFSEENKL